MDTVEAPGRPRTLPAPIRERGGRARTSLPGTPAFHTAASLERPGTRSLFPPVPSCFPWLERAFAPGRATALNGTAGAVEAFLPFLLAATLAQGHRVSLRQGSLRFSPYALVESLRVLGQEPEEALERLRLARAFTVHQLVSLLETWEDSFAVGPGTPDLLVVSDLPVLFADEDVPPPEREALFRHAIARLGRVLRALPRPLLLSGLPEPRELPLPWHEELRLAPGPPGSLRLLQVHWDQPLELALHPPRQIPLERFDPDPTVTGTPRMEVPAWGGPSPPTGKP